MSVPLIRSGYAALEVGQKVVPFEHTVDAILPEHDIDIRVTHNGLCHTDVSMTKNDWGASKFPFIPGHEVVGIVAAVGERVTQFKVGDRVGYAWIKDSCRSCRKCRVGEENLCQTGYTGTIMAGNHGGWQNFMRAPADFAYAIPDKLDSVSAAPLLCAGVTVYTPLKKYMPYPGCKVGVIGIGGLGHLALQFAAAMGAEVTAFSHTAGKEAEAKKFGATNFVCGEESTKAVAGTMDLLINTVSSLTDFKAQMALLCVGGTLCVVGLPGGGAEICVGVTDVVFNGKQVVGSIVGGRNDMQEMLDFAAVKGIKPQCETMPMSNINEAIEKMMANKARYRIVMTDE
ncbi:hypothetical protein FOA52_001712 [Chlamydomonas sp. UWO 241]|nr:hypothetical protein FOA52_001712 [Chlamydomonas sp. UWO 241]